LPCQHCKTKDYSSGKKESGWMKFRFGGADFLFRRGCGQIKTLLFFVFGIVSDVGGGRRWTFAEKALDSVTCFHFFGLHPHF